MEPYRRRGQRFTTVMLRASESFVDETLWPEFVELQKVLHRHLKSVTDRLIVEAIHHDVTDIGERPEDASNEREERPERLAPRES
jgi:hypothetical protein